MPGTIRHIRGINLEDGQSVGAVAVGSNGSMIAVASGKALHIFDSATDRPVQQISLEKPAVGLAFSPDSRFLAVAVDDPTVLMFDRQRGNVVRKLSRRDVPDFLRQKRQQRVVYFPDGKTLLTAGEDNSVTWWDTTSGRWDHLVRTPHAQCITAVSPDGKYVVIAGNANPGEYCGHVTLYRVRRGLQLLWNSSHDGDGRVTYASFSPNGKRLATCGAGDGARVWNVETGKQLAHLAADEKDQPLIATYFVNDDQHLLIASMKELRLRNLETNNMLATTRHPRLEGIRGGVFSDDGSVVVTFGNTATMDLWAVETEAKEPTKPDG